MPSESFKYQGKELEAMAFARNYHNWIYSRFKPFIGNSIIEVGAGSGNFSQLLLTHNPESLTLIEPSKNMFPLLQQKVGEYKNVHLRNEYFINYCNNDPVRADTIIYINTLEHIEDDRGELQLMWDSLKEGGHICIFVPALAWLYGEFDRRVGHFRRYHKKDLVAKAEDAGFRVKDCRYMDLSGVPMWWLQIRVFGKTVIKPYQVSLFDNLIVPVNRIIEGIVNPPLGKNLILIAQK